MQNTLMIGVVLYKTTEDQLVNLMKSVCWQASESVNIKIGLRANDGHHYRREMNVVAEILSSANNIKLFDIEIGKNVGFGAAHNVLCKKACQESCGLYIGANPDGMFHHSSITGLLRAQRNHEKNTLFECLQFPQEHPKIYDPFTFETRWCSGACFAVDPQFFLEIGGFDENIFMYCEDVDLSWRVRATGGKCIVVPEALFFHDVSDDRSQLSVKLQMLRSGRYLAYKWKNETFMRLMEEEMRSLSMQIDVPSISDLNLPRASYPKSIIDQICDFSHLFSFSPARW